MIMREYSFDEIYHQYYRMVMKVASNILKDYNLAQDICQEVFVALYEKSGEIEEEYVKPWLIVNARRKAIDYCKKAYQIHETVSSDKVYNMHLTGTESEIFDEDKMVVEMDSRQLTDQVMENLADYNPAWHTIITRIVVEKRKPQKVACELGITIGNLRTKLHRAKAWIRKEYQDEYESL